SSCSIIQTRRLPAVAANRSCSSRRASRPRTPDQNRRVDRDRIIELFAVFGPVAVRRMFGGQGIFADGLMIALVSGGVIYLKAGEDDRAAFEQEALGPFAYATKLGERALMSYWRMPDRLYDDP